MEELVFDNVTLGELVKEIYNNSKQKSKELMSLKDSIETLLMSHMENPAIVSVLAPVIKSLVDANIKYDEQLIKIAQMLQRQQSYAKSDKSSANLPESEKLLLRDVVLFNDSAED